MYHATSFHSLKHKLVSNLLKNKASLLLKTRVQNTSEKVRRIRNFPINIPLPVQKINKHSGKKHNLNLKRINNHHLHN